MTEKHELYVMRFEGKVAFVTGGASGLGAGTARAFANEGAKVVLFDLQEDLGRKVAEEIKASGGEALFVKGDVSKRDEVEAGVSAAYETFGSVDIVVNSAGILRDALITKMSEEQWDAVIDTNLKGTFLVCQAVAKRWVEACRADRKERIADYPDKRIVNIASMAAEGSIGQVNYSASKAGVVGLTKTLAKELIRYNVRVHAVMPTVIDTPIVAGVLAKDDGKWRKYYEGRIPLGIGKPKYVSDVILFLCGEESWFANGQVFQINGGKLGEL
ncbi:MAG: SDR family NAD(P)-dependent oxidoreductase [Promethearchaeota archaeon]